jgi:predicted nuclease of predicted toxin-antitoxin system
VRFLLDENCPLPSVEALRAAGLDAVAVAEAHAGASDEFVLQWAEREDRILVTFDRDFGELVFRVGASGRPGVVYLRFVPGNPLETAEIVLAVARQSEIQLEGYFTVVDRERARQRRLP